MTWRRSRSLAPGERHQLVLLDLAAIALTKDRSSSSSPATSRIPGKDAGRGGRDGRKVSARCSPTALYARFAHDACTRSGRKCCRRCEPSSAAMSSPRADPCILVIFGASGDLARRKLLPAIYNLAESGLLPEPFAILGVARPAITEDAYRAQVRETIEREEGEPPDPAKWQRIETRLHYISGDFDDPAFYWHVQSVLADLQRDTAARQTISFTSRSPEPSARGPPARRIGLASESDAGAAWSSRSHSL